jgi:phage terminase large subunit
MVGAETLAGGAGQNVCRREGAQGISRDEGENVSSDEGAANVSGFSSKAACHDGAKQGIARPTLNPALRSFWLTPARIRVLYGGRASSKTWDAGGFATYLAHKVRIRVLCARQHQNKIEESVYTVLKGQIRLFGLWDQFDVLKNTIRHKRTGSEFLFYGLWRNIDEIKSLEDVDICWLEEAHNLTEEQWTILEPTLRKEGSQFWVIFNARLITDFAYQRFITEPPPDTIKRKINYTENPFLSQTILKVIETKKAEDEDEFNHIYLGEPLQDDDQAIIKRSWLLASIDAHKLLGITPSGRKRIGFDVADSGADLNAAAETHGIVCLNLDEWKGREDELLKSAGRVHARARHLGAEIVYDSIGVGAFAGAHFQALNAEHGASLSYLKFNAGGEVLDPHERIDKRDPKSPLNGDFYANAKAQAWWDVGIRFRNVFNAVQLHKAGQDWRSDGLTEDDLISINSKCEHLDLLIDELATPRRDYDNRGKAKVESKKDLAKRDITSPNKADAFVMAYSRIAPYQPPTAAWGAWGRARGG